MTIKKLPACLALICVLAAPEITNAQTAVTDNSAYILTPKAGPEPHINGPKIFGVRPGHPVLFTVPVSGNKPVQFEVGKLPKGLRFDKNTGRFSGAVDKPGTYEIKITAKNNAGKAERPLKIVVGENICLTPPMGWNSWNIYATKVTEDLLLANARAMVTSGLIDHGWSYMNIDDVWQGERGGEFHAIQPNPQTFPDIQKASNEIHAMGLKIGIYSTPWIESYGHHVGGSADNPEGTFVRTPETDKVPRNKKLFPYKIGSYMFVDQDVKQWAQWGVDYLKYDWNPIELPETKQMFDALRASGRDIVFSLSNSTPFASIGDLSKVSNTWRTGGDIRDSWKSLKPRLFSQDKWEPYAGQGHWNDPDMMVVGVVGWGKDYHPSNLTADEQYTHVSAWCLMSVPLLLGCDLTKLDAFTLSLLTNDEVLALNQDALGKQATVISRQGDAGVMAKDLEDGSKAVGLFNPGDEGTKQVVLNWADLKITGKYIVRDLWRQKDLGTFEGEFKADVAQHGVVLVSLRKAK
ncbi:putative Ig domain-containing protein [Mucilaginibacter sp. PPCGB 2223]|uniref:putative Ig domain-containing protein n=1 Tax=Mucilaginibacter sp. PPCGB 2223 TaxID=1886027 RepID=UPI0009F6BC2A|nr:putative Ig domain-containing protein [Mucilaginibacter sp. PPCGB 2223]